MNVFIDDVIRKLLEMRNDGYYYCEINEIGPDIIDDDDDIPPFLSFSALECGGMGAVDYNDDPETDVLEVSESELEEYAEQHCEPSPNRKKIKEIKITY